MSEGILKGNIKNKLSQNKVKISLIAGIGGIFLILISSFFPSGNKTEKSAESAVPFTTSTEYCEQLEQKVKDIVTGITGSKKAVVVVTLDTSVQYVYADNKKQQSSKSEESDKSENSDTNEFNYIIVKDSNGQERPLIITEYMPSVRGVAIVCEGSCDAAMCEQIKNAVMSALNITSKKIYVTGK